MVIYLTVILALSILIVIGGQLDLSFSEEDARRETLAMRSTHITYGGDGKDDLNPGADDQSGNDSAPAPPGDYSSKLQQ